MIDTVKVSNFTEEVDKKVKEILPILNGLSVGHIEAILSKLENAYKVYPIVIG